MAHPHPARPLILMASLIVLSGCDQSSPAGATPPRPVKSVIAHPIATANATFAGVVQPRIETTLGFRTLGRIIARRVEVGDVIRKGTLVAEIDPLALRLAVTAAEADLRNAEAQLENAGITDRRKRSLAATNAGSVADLDAAVQGLKSAQANVVQAQASLAKAREQLSYTELRAEFDGVVTATSAEVGQVVASGQSVLTMARLEERDAVVDIPEPQLALLRLGAPFDIALQLDGDVTTTGVLREIGPQADGDTRMRRVKIALQQAPEVFRLGSVIHARARREGTDAPFIPLPASAILNRDGADYVWTVSPADRKLTLRRVELAAAPDDAAHVRVRAGIEEGDEVAVAGVKDLAEGQTVGLSQGSKP